MKWIQDFLLHKYEGAVCRKLLSHQALANTASFPAHASQHETFNGENDGTTHFNRAVAGQRQLVILLARPARHHGRPHRRMHDVAIRRSGQLLHRQLVSSLS